MSRDSSLFARQAIIARLKGEPTVTALVPAERIFPGERPPQPEWPFIAYGRAVVTPFAASCLDGTAADVALHVYAETTGEGDTTAPGEDMAAAIARVLVAVLDGAALDLADTDCPWPATAHIHWSGTNVVPDNADGSAWHGIVSFSINVSS